MKSQVLAIGAALLLVPAFIYGQAAALDRDVPGLLTQNHVPSVSIAQIKNGKIVLTRAYGQQDSHAAASIRTLYNIASLTKPITAQVAMRLLSQDVIKLDEPMAPIWTDPDIAEDDRRDLLTPRIALTHQTGFANWRSMTGGKLAFAFTPGTAYGYSGEGFEYLTRFMEKKTGMRLDEEAKKLVLDPLGMRDTAFTWQPWFAGRIASPADDKGNWQTPAFAEKPISADKVYTTAKDYALLLKAALDNKGVTPAIALERDQIQVSQKEQICSRVPHELCPDEFGQGLCWLILKSNDTVVLMHTGHDPGLYTFAYLSPTKRSGAVILTNGENGKKLIPVIMRDLDAPQAFVKTLQVMMQ